MPLNPQRKLELSPEARAALKLPLKANDWELLDADKRLVASLDYCAQDAELAAFIAALVNEALTPAAPAVTISPETTTELRQLITTELEAEQRWTAEDIMRREG